MRTDALTAFPLAANRTLQLGPRLHLVCETNRSSTRGDCTSRTLLDMLRHRHHPTHFTVDQAVEAADRIGAESTWFVHMAHEIAHAEVDAQLPDGMGLAWDGLRF